MHIHFLVYIMNMSFPYIDHSSDVIRNIWLNTNLNSQVISSFPSKSYGSIFRMAEVQLLILTENILSSSLYQKMQKSCDMDFSKVNI